MGKQSRRKRQRSKRPSSSTAAPPNVEEESPSTLLQKLRHADPQTRHAALIALTCTLLHPEQLSSSNNANRVVSSDILNAVRELVLNENLECAHAAAKCCTNFVQFGHRRDKSQLTAGWVLVFFQRLVSCHQALTTTTTHQRKQWLAVTVQSLTALCALVEMNPLALEYISEASNTDTIEFVPLVISLVKFAKETLETASSMTRSQDQDEYIREIAIYSLRILHSALDDNSRMLQTWCASNDATEEWKTIHQACTCPSLPFVARLHAAGCLVTARHLCLDINDCEEWRNLWQHAVLETVLPLLQQSIVLPTNYTILIQEWIQTNALLQEQEEDCAMEQDVLSAIDAKGESAKSIAKRQAQLKQNGSDSNEEMKTKTTLPKQVDAQEVWNQVQRTWHDAISPIQLALELVTNVTSIEPPNSHNEDDDNSMMNDNDVEEMEMAWGPEQEEALLLNNTRDGVSTVCHPLDVALLTSLAQSGLGETLVTLLQSVCRDNVDESSSSLPQSVKTDVQDLQSKSAAALGNYLGNVMDWQIPTTLWKDLQLAAESSTGVGTEGVFDAMAVAMQTRPQIRTQIQQDDLEFLMGQLSCTTSSDKAKADVVSILGLLCSAESHPRQVNEKVCSGLLSLLQSSSSAMAMSDVLNALMDMYGDDENHVQVFESLNVLGNFQRNLPRFKQRIQAERNKAPEQSVQEWRETALNASRFISYKKGQL